MGIKEYLVVRRCLGVEVTKSAGWTTQYTDTQPVPEGTVNINTVVPVQPGADTSVSAVIALPSAATPDATPANYVYSIIAVDNNGKQSIPSVPLTVPFDDYPNNVASAKLVTVGAPQYSQSGHHHKASDIDTFKFTAPISGTYYFSSTSKIAISVLDVSSNPGGVTVPRLVVSPTDITPVETPITPPVTVAPSNPITVTPPSVPVILVPSDPFPGRITRPVEPINPPVEAFGISVPSGAESEASFSSYNASAESESLLATESLPTGELQPDGEPVQDGNFPIALVANKTYVIRVKPTNLVAVPGSYGFVVQVPSEVAVLGSIHYYFYLPEWKDEAVDGEKRLAAFYGVKEEEIVLKEITSPAQFKADWNAMGMLNGNKVNIGTVAINTHANNGGLQDDQGKMIISSSEIAKLDKKSAGRLILLGCNAGHLDYKDNNPAANFARNLNGTKVFTSDGTVHYGRRILYVAGSYWYDSRNDDFFTDQLVKGTRDNEGWLVYKCESELVRISESLGKIFTLTQMLLELGKLE